MSEVMWDLVQWCWGHW